ncbi:MAG: efflux RND transporter periplasmic adaptor subunit, partial [Bacteroidota bacterium]
VVAVPIQAVTLRKPQGGDQEGPKDEGGAEKNKEQESKEVIFVYQGGKVEQVQVETGISDDTYIEISEGLEADTEIVTGNYNTLSKILRDGMEVEKGSGKKKSWERAEK